MTATIAFKMSEMPKSVAEAEEFIVLQMRTVFAMATASSATSIRDFNMVREFNSGDPFGQNVRLFLAFNGDPEQTFVTTAGEVSAP